MPNLPERYALTQEVLEKHLNRKVDIKRVSRLEGGCINLNLKVQSSAGTFVLKLNDSAPADFFAVEAAGLDALAATQSISLPLVLGQSSKGDVNYLLLEYLEPRPAQQRDWQLFGESLAQLHRQRQPYFGWERDNYIGSLPQRNRQKQSWAAFFREERLLPQIEAAAAHIPSKLHAELDELMGRLEQLFPKEPPSLLHGDLWSGNAHACSQGIAAIDPAVYFGHREMDLGMTQLFGGFPAVFLEAYRANYPLKSGWKERLELCNLYPLLVHLNLFGRSYLGGIRQVVQRFR